MHVARFSWLLLRASLVTAGGPYAIVRHPGYASAVVATPASALALGSWWGLAPALAVAALFVWRAADEDRFLTERLDGYRSYRERVRFRLLPRVW